MTFLLWMAMVLTCEFGLTYAGDDPYFANFRAVYHGHGATSYQNVHVDNHDSVPINENYKVHHTNHLEPNSDHQDDETVVIPILGQYSYGDHDELDKVLYQEASLHDDENSHIDAASEYYGSYEDDHGYDYYI